MVMSGENDLGVKQPMTELTVESLRDARFREGWRGYNPADVDAFIDQISTGVQSLQDRIRELVARAERSESRTIGENDETVKRTLVLAQRAADLVVSEAKLVSERIVSDAHRDADRILREADTDADLRRQTMAADLERDHGERLAVLDGALAAHEARHRAARDVADRERTVLQAEIEELQSQATSARDRLRSVLTDHLVRLDRLGDFGIADAVLSEGVADSSATNSSFPGVSPTSAALDESIAVTRATDEDSSHGTADGFMV